MAPPSRGRRIDRAVSLEDVARLARRRLPRVVREFVEGGAEDETAVAGNRQAFAEWDLLPRALVGVERRQTKVTVLGHEIDLPVVLGPVGLARLAHRNGEVAAARAAARAGTVFTLSTGSSCSIEEVAQAAPGACWFQLYLWRDRALVESLLHRAAAAGYSALVLTVDVPCMGRRERDLRNGMTIPPRLRPSTAFDVLRRPRWLAGLMFGPRITFANLAGVPGRGASVSELGRYTNEELVNPGADWETLAWLRRQWDGPLAVKGILHPNDARRAVACGADGIVVSNHGGRQLDAVVPSLRALPDVVDAVGGRADVILDGGVRRGTDVAKALALGARAVSIGRPYVQGLGAAGEVGASAVVELLRAEFDAVLALVGCPDANRLDRSFVVPAGGGLAGNPADGCSPREQPVRPDGS